MTETSRENMFALGIKPRPPSPFCLHHSRNVNIQNLKSFMHKERNPTYFNKGLFKIVSPYFKFPNQISKRLIFSWKFIFILGIKSKIKIKNWHQTLSLKFQELKLLSSWISHPQIELCFEDIYSSYFHNFEWGTDRIFWVFTKSIRSN